MWHKRSIYNYITAETTTRIVFLKEKWENFRITSYDWNGNIQKYNMARHYNCNSRRLIKVNREQADGVKS